MSFPTSEYEQELARLATGETTKAGSLTLNAEDFDLNLDTQIQTDKPAAKLLPCRDCKRPLVVTTFYAPAKAQCSMCAGGEGRVASVGQPIPGQTEPAKAVHLEDVLVNKSFAQALCPVHPGDESHEMLLVNVVHNPHYGPSMLIEYKNGIPQYRQIDVGETVTHQCQACLATVSYSTTTVVRLKPVNEPRVTTGKGANTLAEIIGVREPTEYPDYEALRTAAEAKREEQKEQVAA